MSCSRCADQTSAGAQQGTQSPATAALARPSHCPRCGGFLTRQGQCRQPACGGTLAMADASADDRPIVIRTPLKVKQFINGKWRSIIRVPTIDPSPEMIKWFNRAGYEWDPDVEAFVTLYTLRQAQFAWAVANAKTLGDVERLARALDGTKLPAWFRASIARPRPEPEKKVDDRLSSHYLADLYSRLASGLVGKPRRVILQIPPDGSSGFGTDMQGRIYAHPYPLGKDAPERENITVTRAGMEHELGHELYTPMPVWQAILEIADSPTPVEGLDKGRSIVAQCFNIVEDGRMERELVARNAGVAVGLAASCKRRPRWGGTCGGRDDRAVAADVSGALLYTALPYFEPSPQDLDKMSPRARRLFEALAPMVARAVHGTPEDSYHAAIAMAKAFEAEGLVNVPQYSSPPPSPPAGTPRWQPGGGRRGENDKARCPHCGGFLTAEGVCNSPACPGPSRTPRQPSRGRADNDKQAKEARHSQGEAGDGFGQEGDKQERDAGGDPKPGEEEGQSGGGDNAGKNQSGQGNTAGDQTGPARGEDTTGSNDGAGKNRSAQDSNQRDGMGGGRIGSAEDKAAVKGGDDRQGNQGWVDGQISEGQAPAGGCDRASDAVPQFSQQALDEAMKAFESEANARIEFGIKRANSFEVLGKDLHAALGTKSEIGAQKARAPGSNEAQEVLVRQPRSPDYKKCAERHRAAVKSVANRLAVELQDIQETARRSRERYQDEGRFDRSRVVAAYKGERAIYAKDSMTEDTTLTASIVVDMSDSMKEAVRSGALYRAVGAVSEAMSILDLPHEIRAFSGSNYQSDNLHLKAMDDPCMEDERVGMLAYKAINGTFMHESALLAGTSLMGREEHNKLMIVLTDGSLEDFGPTRKTLAALRKRGVLTFGIFYGQPSDYMESNLDLLYGFSRGQRNWVAISDMAEFPKKVGRKIADIFNSLER